MESVGDLTVMVLLVVLDFCKLTERREFLKLITVSYDLNLLHFSSEEELSAARPFVSIDTTLIKAKAGEGCPRCGGAVFAAEQMLAKSSMWHKRCFSCSECKRPLDSVLACDGPDKEVKIRLKFVDFIIIFNFKFIDSLPRLLR